MKSRGLIALFSFFSIPAFLFGQSTGVGTTLPHPSAQLDITSTNKGMLPPRMNSAQRDAIPNPAQGLMIFNTEDQYLQIFTSIGWLTVEKTNYPIEKLLGGNGQEQYAFIQKTTDGSYIVAGASLSSANGDVSNLNHGGSDVWLVLLDRYGNFDNNRLLGGNGDESVKSIQQTSNTGLIFAGYSTSSQSGDVAGINHGFIDAWVVKSDINGDIEWEKLLGGSSDEEATSIMQTTDGGYIVAGYSWSSANGNVTATNHGMNDYWIVKMDAAGNIIWNKLLGGTGNEYPTSIQQTADGGYIVAGYSTSSANGNITGVNHGLKDYWVLKLDASGNITWNKLLGGNADDIAYSVLQTTDGGYIVAGASKSSANGDVTATNHGLNDYWIVKLDALGNVSWNKLLGGSNDDIAYSIQKCAAGGYIIAGYSGSSSTGDITGANHGSTDYWVVRLSEAGNVIIE